LSRFKSNFFLLLFFFILVLFIFPFNDINGIFQVDRNEKKDPLKIHENFPVQKPTKDELHLYNISVDYSPVTHSASGWINVSFLNKETFPVSDLLFHLWGNGIQDNSISIHNILNNSGYTLVYAINETKLNVTTELILPNQRYNISINFTTLLPELPKGGRFGYTEYINSFHAFGNWHPILAVRENGNWNLNPIVNRGEGFYSEMAYFDIWIRTNSSDKIAAAADLQEVLKINNKFIYHYTAGPVRDFSWITSPDYRLYSEIYKGINITSYYFSGNHRFIDAVDITKKSLDLFSEIFEPWPYETMNIAELEPAIFSGMEYNQLIMINGINYDLAETSKERFEDIISHEWAHSWNTYLVANNPYIDPWLDESWAMYATSLYYEEYGKNIFKEGRHESLKTSYFEFLNENPDQFLGSGFEYWDFNPGITEVVYQKGAVIIDMLRYVMGDEAFFNAIEDLYDTFSYKTVSASEYIDLFNSHIDDDISWFFDQFVYDTDILEYEILSANAFENETNDNWEITINIKNKYEEDPNVMKVPLDIKFNSGDMSSFDIIIDEALEIILLDLPLSMGEPEFVILDPDWKLLRHAGTISKNFGTGEENSSSSNPPTTNLFFLPSVMSILTIIYYRSKKSA
jgi:hypothetical protein